MELNSNSNGAELQFLGELRVTISNSLHGNASSILAVTPFKELNNRASMLLWWVQRVQSSLVSPQLFHCTSTKRVTCSNQY